MSPLFRTTPQIICDCFVLPVSFSPTSGNMYNIKKMQIVMPHPVSIVQAISYDGNLYLYFNITLDLRSAKDPWFLRTAFTDAVKSVATATGVDKKT